MSERNEIVTYTEEFLVIEGVARMPPPAATPTPQVPTANSREWVVIAIIVTVMLSAAMLCLIEGSAAKSRAPEAGLYDRPKPPNIHDDIPDEQD